MCSHDCTQLEIVLNVATVARRSKANLMLRMCLLSSSRKKNKQFGGQKPVDGFSVRWHKSAIANYGISYESNRPYTTGPATRPFSQ